MKRCVLKAISRSGKGRICCEKSLNRLNVVTLNGEKQQFFGCIVRIIHLMASFR